MSEQAGNAASCIAHLSARHAHEHCACPPARPPTRDRVSPRTVFFSNFGPNSTTFILPAETFPTHLRSTLNGFCAASGKLGATIGSAAFVPLKSAIGLGMTMVACAVVSLLGMLLTLAFVEDRRGKDMEGEGESTLEPSLLADQGTNEVSAAQMAAGDEGKRTADGRL